MIHVLLIEDNPDDVELAKRVFEKLGITDQVLVVGDGADALNFLLGRGTFAGQGMTPALQLILMDLNLPKMSGLDVLHQIRASERTRHLPVVILTVSRKEPDLLQSFTMGISDYLIKPLEADRFGQIYRKYVRTEPT